ncbi:hypothetical protein ACLEPN_20195 [Myxococcus sp. 1LA]
MRFTQSFLLPLAVLSLGVLPACSDDGDDNPPGNDAGTTDAGTTAPEPRPQSAPCPDHALLCEQFDDGASLPPYWMALTENATLQVDPFPGNGGGAL